MQYKQPTHSNGKEYGGNKAPVNQSGNEFYPFDLFEITSREADEIEAHYSSRYKWT
ncbi:MAG: hypothetical protein Q7S11_02465 [bacterium]|nr:hypothetical protein [bacterium]